MPDSVPTETLLDAVAGGDIYTAFTHAVMKASVRIHNESKLNLYRENGETNQSGDRQTDMDQIADDAMRHECEQFSSCLAEYESEESDGPIHYNDCAAHTIIADAFDGSKNQATGGTTAIISGLVTHCKTRSMRRIVASVIGVFGPRLEFVVSIDNDKPRRLILDPFGNRLITRIPKFTIHASPQHAVLGGQIRTIPEEVFNSVHDLKLRSSGCFGYDAIATVFNGGLFCYLEPKLRVFEAWPVGHFVRNAGGSIFAIHDDMLLELDDLSQYDANMKVGVILGNPNRVQSVIDCLGFQRSEKTLTE